MNGHVLALVHGIEERYWRASLGTLLPALQRRGLQVEIKSADEHAPLPPPSEFRMILVMGSHASVYDESLEWVDRERRYLRTAIDSEIPILGVCFGAQILACVVGGSVALSKYPEHGLTTVHTTDPDFVGAGPWLEFHHDTITVPDRVRVIAKNDAGVQAFTYGPHLGVQFHPEASPEWLRAWSSSIPDLELYLGSHGVDSEQFARDIAMNSATAARDCDRLLDRFLARAGVFHSQPV
ncbi:MULTISPECIES: type 1 glutamine amidotransferase [Rhodococcus]|uniref:Aniline dioxygenase n=1 Tax=Rhodococcus sp. AN-22 TaxID=200251 RepID=C0STU0_9NOCA|nr:MULTISPECIES: type 1 glutamine amidotransferase [Rhodococcus]UTT51081.1 type 1 glutamine amidotransferase [Rhodococcus gordoniae]BAH56721.1 component of aniline dioxygenase [Rhodococcus sp. AN-22]BAI63580.1 aniline dioxygenase [Rhodococcus sp. AN-22]